MRIGIDARELCGHRTGVGRYLGGLLREWSTSDHARCHEFVLYAPEPIGIRIDTRRFAIRVVSGRGGTIWEQRQLPTAIAGDHLDAFFAPGYTAPLLLPLPLVVAIHDVSFAAHPEWFTMREGLRRRFLSRRAAARAGAVITISEFSKRELIDRLGVPPDRIHVIPPGVSAPASFESPSQDALPSSPIREGDPSDPAAAAAGASRVLYVGSIFNRRRLPDLIQAFALVARRYPAVSMDIVGEDRSHPRVSIPTTIHQLQMERQVRWHRYISDTDLARLYRSARAFAFLSEYEGLGFTPLEALASGVPSVLLDIPVARETCGAAALYVNKGEVERTAEALERVLFDEPTRRTLLSAAPAVLARFDWSRAADNTLAVIESTS